MSTPRQRRAGRLALVCPLSPPLYSGASAAAFRLGESLVARGWRVTVIACRTPGQVARETIDGCEVLRPAGGRLNAEQHLGALAKLHFSIRSAMHLLRSRREYDAVLFFGAGRVALPAVLACAMRGLPVVIRPTHIDDDTPQALRDRPLGQTLAGILSRARGFVAISPRILDSIGSDPQWSRPPSVLIPNAVDTAVLAPATDEERASLRRRLGWRTDERVAIFVGVLSPEKGVGDLLDAWEQLPDRTRRHSRLVLAGGHLDRERNIALFQRATTIDGVEAPGRIPPEGIAERLRAADLFVLPTHGEGLPNALLEAMACGLPSVVSRLEGINDYLIEDGERGRLVAIGDARGLSEALEETIENAETARDQGRHARAWIEANASREVVAEAWESFLGSIIEGGSR
jgi:glycosyltransferase involved in cell wall biosynthesis